ncbi:hypothetical protein AYO21_10690 [Fonsecaea monophora]|uniref:Carrier domain-containing protein n=1 Tax=Fonsecaea monophora TaxID=254056 RepID=A0A177ESY0_9EURO|nr:hypothetical protein AYO21_10690 [Fonsecaea monophora]KAH0835265.1 putative nonribosomal peptide synthase SidD [Fonsecaea pedrosoi]OAG35123.1 hypothetical protein AYO21_10690 [Fonsecaea monophora]
MIEVFIERHVLPNFPKGEILVDKVGSFGSLNGDAAAVSVPWANAQSFDIPGLASKSTDQQLNLLLLAFALVLHRGSINDEGDSFSWGLFEPSYAAPSLSILSETTKLSDILEDELESVAKILKRLSNVRKRFENYPPASRSILSMEAEGRPVYRDRSAPLFRVDTWVHEHRLFVWPSHEAYLSGTDMAKFQIAAFVDMLDTISSNQEQTVGAALQMGKRELALLWGWNKTVPPVINRCMHDIIAEKMIEHPNKPAVRSWDGEATYGQLDRLSAFLAARLSALGVKPGSVVILCFEKSMWTSVALLAVMRAGGAFVLTDPSQPEARLATIAAEVEARVVITSRQQAGLGGRIAPNAEVVVADEELWKSSLYVPQYTPIAVPPASLLYIIFTSGSTGKPKAIPISHQNFTSGAIPRGDAVGYRAHSRVLDFPSYAFDVSIDCMLCTLCAGGCICVPSEEQRVNDLSGVIKSLDVNMAHMTPSVARLLSRDAMASLEVLGLGGESLSSSDAAIWSQITKLIIAYGPSECTVGCTINNTVHTDRLCTSIGKGVGGVTWLVDPNDHNLLTPVGGIGELLIEGAIVGAGYLNEPEKTAEVFIQDPTWLLAGSKEAPGRHGRFYKTGDLVKYDPDGSGAIVFVGRKDRQVKLRGQRVELTEIEHHLLTKLEEGTQVAAEVITPGSKDREPTLVAFISEMKDNQVPVNGGVAFSAELRRSLGDIDQYLAEVLPSYMVPTAYIPLAAMPLLVSCKVDRKRIQEIGLSITPQQLAALRAKVTDNHEPQTEREVVLQRIWAQLLGEGLEIGTSDSFFRLGGDSLKAMKLVAAAQAEGLWLTVADIFAHPTLASMASSAGSVNHEVKAEIAPFSLLGTEWGIQNARLEVANLCQLAPSDIEDVYPCTSLQEGLMALSAKNEDAYVAQRVLDLPSLIIAEQLKAAFDTVAGSSPILRTRIVQVPGRGLMQVVVGGELQWSRSRHLDEYLARDREESMGLGDKLARFAIVSNGDQGRAHLVLTIHHALYDGWSMPLIVHRVNEVFQGREAVPPTPFVSFINYLQSMNWDDSATFWREQLAGAVGRHFPIMPYTGYQPHAGSLLEHYTKLPKSNSSSTTLAVAIRAAWVLVAARYASCDDPVFGETLTGRNSPVTGIGEIEGPLITTVPMRVHVDWQATVSEYVQAIHEQITMRIPHEHMGLQHIRKVSPDALTACELKTGIVLHPKAEDVQIDLDQSPAYGFVPVDDLEAAREALKFNSYALMLVCSLDSSGFLTMASFDSKTVDLSQMQQILSEFGHTVQELCEGRERPLSSLAIFQSRKRQDQIPITGLALHEVAKSEFSELIKAPEAVKGLWIVDTKSPSRLLPTGAVGEVLIETSSQLSAPAIASPAWFAEANAGDSHGQTCLYSTGLLAKSQSDGSLVFLGKKDSTHESLPPTQTDANAVGKQEPRLTPRLDQLRGLWSRILGVPEAEITSNSSFFALGGDSIGVMKLVSEARMECLELKVADVFDHRHLDEMAEIMKVIHSTTKADILDSAPFSALEVENPEAFVSNMVKPLLARQDWEITDVLPARPLQEIAVGGTIKLPRYSARYELLYFQSAVNRGRLFKAAQDLVARNEILRTVFVRLHGEYCAVVLKSLQVEIVEHEINGDVEEFSRKLCDLDIQVKMPLGGAFVKFFFVQSENGKGALILKISHAQYDEICLPNLLHQLAALYEERVVQETVPFSSYVYHVIKENVPQGIQYWRELLKGSSMTTLRPELPRRSDKITSLTKAVDISSRNKETTIATLPVAAWALTLARRLAIRDITFGEVVSGRNIGFPNCDMVVGPTWQYVPVRIQFAETWTTVDLLRYVQQLHITSSRFEGIGLKEIVEHCTDWPSSVDWFDSVVHQDVAHVTDLSFSSTPCRLETIYPHLEPLREWKVQAFLEGNTMTLEIVTFEDWCEFATALLDDLVASMNQLVQSPTSLLF